MNIKTLLSLLVLGLSLSLTAQTATVDIEQSSIEWVGKKVTGQHNGTINILSGELKMVKGKLSGGNFIIDMNSLVVTDLKEGQGKEKLEGHLRSDDFFSIEANPEATLEIDQVIGLDKEGNYVVSGRLTIKGITNDIGFKAHVADGTATATINIDRTKYDIKYGSSSFFDDLKDKAINDEFTLNVKLIY